MTTLEEHRIGWSAHQHDHQPDHGLPHVTSHHVDVTVDHSTAGTETKQASAEQLKPTEPPARVPAPPPLPTPPFGTRMSFPRLSLLLNKKLFYPQLDDADPTPIDEESMEGIDEELAARGELRRRIANAPTEDEKSRLQRNLEMWNKAWAQTSDAEHETGVGERGRPREKH